MRTTQLEPELMVTPLVVGHDALLGEVRGLYGAERQFLQTLGLMAQAVYLSRVKHAIVTLVTGTGSRLWRLEEVFAVLGEEIGGSRCPGLLDIVESRWLAQQHRLQHRLLELHIVGTTLQAAASHLAVLYAVAERRACALRLSEVVAHLAASRADAEAMARVVAQHTGVHPDSGGRPVIVA